MARFSGSIFPLLIAFLATAMSFHPSIVLAQEITVPSEREEAPAKEESAQETPDATQEEVEATPDASEEAPASEAGANEENQEEPKAIVGDEPATNENAAEAQNERATTSAKEVESKESVEEEPVLATKSENNDDSESEEESFDATPQSDYVLGEGKDEGANLGVWVSASISVGALVVGSIFGVIALDKESAFRLNPSAALADEGESFAIVTDAFLGIALLGAIAAVVFYFVGDEPSDEDPDSDTKPTFTIAPAIGRNAGGVQAAWSF